MFVLRPLVWVARMIEARMYPLLTIEVRPISPAPLGPFDMPRVFAALSPEGLEHAAFSIDEVEQWEIAHPERAGLLRIVEYSPVNVRRPL
jgi:hypothetical protein